ncbi:sigma 54-interacting transcriptional regulator [Marinisporobacter balticus]|uniref:PAS domain S-box-containing protein n=1 Tax=Marinisporobacter balticus TaxID=2018667 RepID=A0A4R2KZJ7_9FIRM|nr:sigma 54-interacting transcriptional regulator [Marinisporobacter balticus]TCO76879.1 PAS domain S-box-containing protein [Marinisporobacter balticus]
MKEVVLIAPYEKMYQLSVDLISQHDYKNIEVVRGDLQEGVRAAYKAVDCGAKVVISRGGTFTLIKDVLNVPVVEIQTSAYDVIANIKHIVGQNEPLAIIGHNNIIYGYDLIKEIVKKVKKVDIERGESVAQKIKGCVAEGVHVFIGDAVVNNICKELGYTCYMLESGQDAIRSAIEEANRILMVSKYEIERSKRYMALIDYVHDGVIATDEKNRILLFNSVAQEILGILKEYAIGRKIQEFTQIGSVLEEILQSKTLIDEVRKLGDTQVTISNIPIMVNDENKGSVTVFQDITKLQNLEKEVRIKMVEKGFVAKHTFSSIIHKSNEMEHCITVAKKFSRYDSSVLIEGSSGVGKELFAQSIHNESRRRTGPFVAINCAALPRSIIESELFGYVEGAFTGSKKKGKAGVFELAHKGIIFLDEISELPIDVQGRLLRVIQEREIMRLGDNKVIPLDVRIVCATNRNLKEMVKQGTFRRDLLYRINTLSFYIPPLSQRKDDIDVMVLHFLKRYCNKYSKKIDGFTKSAMDYLMIYDYEGNIRELQGMIERAVIICEDTMIKKYDLENNVNYKIKKQEQIVPQDCMLGEIAQDLPSLKDIEKRYISCIYNMNQKSTSKTCEILKIDRTTLWRKMKK